MTISFSYAARSDVGLLRSSNQDSGYAGPHLCLLCDGMGGPAGGDLASAIAVEHLALLDADSHQASDMLTLLRDAVEAAHSDLAAHSHANPDLAGLGTTCIALMRSGNKLAMVHVGDSRAYLLRDGELTQVTTDHTFVEYLVETGRLSREEAKRHPQRSVLLRVLGDAEGEVQLDESVREACPGDRWLLCSDGLSGPVSAETIAEVLSTTPEPGAAADQLIELALRAGGPDNVTAVVVDVVEDAPQPQTIPQIVGSAARHLDALDAQRTVSSGTDGSSPAAKAAALVAGLEESSSAPVVDEDPAFTPAATHRRRSVILSVLLTIAVLWLAIFAGYRWTQTQYYVTIDSDHIAIYHGIPATIGPVSLSDKVEVFTSPTVAELEPRMRERLIDTVTQPSLEAAREYVKVTVSSYVDQSSTATPAPLGASVPSTEPSEEPTLDTDSPADTAGTGASASPTPTGGTP